MSPFAAVTLLNGSVTLRRAAAADLPELIALLAADQLAIGRDGIDTPADLDHYQNAFAAIDRDAAQLLLVAATPTKIVGTLQLTVIPGLSRRGSLRGQIEAVRVHERHRGLGLGSAMIGWAVEECRRRGCSLVQLTSDKRRADALRFYERLGFAITHEGLKRLL